MPENLKFYKGLEEDLQDVSPIEIGAIYHCTDTGNTYIGISATRMQLFSTATPIDATFRTAGAAADAKAVDDRFKALPQISAVDDGEGNITLGIGLIPAAEGSCSNGLEIHHQ